MILLDSEGLSRVRSVTCAWRVQMSARGSCVCVVGSEWKARPSHTRDSPAVSSGGWACLRSVSTISTGNGEACLRVCRWRPVVTGCDSCVCVCCSFAHFTSGKLLSGRDESGVFICSLMCKAHVPQKVSACGLINDCGKSPNVRQKDARYIGLCWCVYIEQSQHPPYEQLHALSALQDVVGRCLFFHVPDII